MAVTYTSVKATSLSWISKWTVVPTSQHRSYNGTPTAACLDSPSKELLNRYKHLPYVFPVTLYQLLKTSD